MDKFNMKERRKAIRTEVLKPEAWLLNEDYKLLAISETGAFLGTNKVLGPDNSDRPTQVIFELPHGIGMLIVPVEVVSVNWHKTKDRPNTGYAVRFNPILEQDKRMLGGMVQHIRESQIEEVSRRILEEFFTGKGPKFV